MINAFGLNSFGQTIPSGGNGEWPADITRVLYCTWESSFGINEKGHLVVWGYNPQTGSLTSGAVPFHNVRATDVVKVYGDSNSTIGLLLSDGSVYHYSVPGSVEPVLVASDCKDVACMAGSQTVILIKNNGEVYHAPLNGRETPIKMDMPAVQGAEASFYHAILYCSSPFAVYGMGSNRFGQLGSPESPKPLKTIPVAFFDGLTPTQFQISCGTFHTAFVLDGDVYICGLGTHRSAGNHDDDQGYPVLAEFQDKDGHECDVNIVKVACGGKHIIAIDDQGGAWGVGSNKYGQLPKGNNGLELNPIFHRLELNAVDCWAGPQNSFLQIK
ncbi:regulator of chromosome condensation 1/beta-lactamase-inhibitor protein II [Umbelopsis sp. AD052]|nr:regulator of chromosome condensation 1/beta-lactamase-inhibitor protein II [Umbelopsis sp. AD052]